jgi:ATP-binding cassette, subfamily B, bacterial
MKLFPHNKFRFYHQLESSDCGPACLAMVASSHGLNYSVKEIKKFCAITRMGVSVQDILKGGTEMGFKSTALKLTLPQLEEIPLPCILFWKQDHFIVLRQIKRKRNKVEYYLADPGYGKILLDEEMVVKEWMGNNDKGVAIVMQYQGSAYEGLPKKREAEKKGSAQFLKPVFLFLRQNKFKYLAACLLLLVGLLASWAMPMIFKRIIDEGIGNKSLHVVWLLLIAQFGLFLGNFLSDSFSNWTLTKINFGLSILLKKNLLHKLMRLPVSYFDTRLNTDTLQRLGDQGKIQNFVTWKGVELVLSLLNIIVFSTILFFLNKIVFFIYLVLSVFSIVWVSFFLKLRAVLEYSLFLRQSENSNSLYEFIMHMPEIKVNNAQHTVIDKILKIQEKLNKIELRSLFLNMYQMIGVRFFTKLKEVLAVALCAYLIIKGQMTLGALLSISYILGQLSSPIQNFINYIRDAQDASIAKKRVNDIYLEDDENVAGLSNVPEKIEHISIENLQFKYPGSFNPFVLNDVSFDIPINKITAIIGQSGSGKTTLLKLLLAYYPLSSGTIFLNDKSLGNYNSEEWRRQCGIVLQDGHIFSGTIAENIAFSDPSYNVENLKNAAKIACIDTFIESLPMGYNTKVGNVGIQLSGGQKQRLLIARAVYKNPKFIFLDEATSSLDANNEKTIMQNLETFFADKTVVVIAHRLSTVKNADQIIVLEKGEIVEVGKHDDLTAKKKRYFELVKNQLELGN